MPKTEAGKQILDVIYGMDPQGLYPPDPAVLINTVEEEAANLERARIIDLIADIPVTIKFKEPVTKIDLWRYHADIISAIMKAQR